jgi:hypothetical protein
VYDKYVHSVAEGTTTYIYTLKDSFSDKYIKRQNKDMTNTLFT